ncbi:hypothetical protein LIG30_4081 [Burkholderia sp. lig30]|jgi:predicted MFS family arabinose efflux permease|nr:hypothetical protein LIG30_4081 [Burkholderia sp. lig30]
MLAWGAVAFGNVPGLQVRIVKQARRSAPDAADVASGFNVAAFNLGVFRTAPKSSVFDFNSNIFDR